MTFFFSVNWYGSNTERKVIRVLDYFLSPCKTLSASDSPKSFYPAVNYGLSPSNQRFLSFFSSLTFWTKPANPPTLFFFFLLDFFEFVLLLYWAPFWDLRQRRPKAGMVPMILATVTGMMAPEGQQEYLYWTENLELTEITPLERTMFSARSTQLLFSQSAFVFSLVTASVQRNGSLLPTSTPVLQRRSLLDYNGHKLQESPSKNS